MIIEEIKEGDIVEIEYIAEFTKEHINEGRALVMWKGFNHQPLVRKLETKTTIWSNYEHIARVLGHIDIEEYMDKAIKALEQEPKEMYAKGYADGQRALSEHIELCREEKEKKTGHCKDCKYYHIAWDGTETHYYTDYWCEWVEPNENDFCSLYEPKKEVEQ